MPTYDTRRIILSMQETATDQEVCREVGFGSAFAMVGAKTKERMIQDWIEERGNPQHSTATHKADLQYVSWEYVSELNIHLAA
jgi:hypothetical protein